jgi:serine/threonine-protein kinase
MEMPIVGSFSRKMGYDTGRQGDSKEVASLVGRKLGRYEIAGVLGAGGMGEVYRARDTDLDRPVAVKVISERIAQSRTAIERFEREARTVARLSHPNILEIHDFGRDEGVVYAVTELLEGKDLRDRIRAGLLPLSKAMEIGIAVADGLAAAHSKGIVHRDIKPDNVFITSTGQVKILDFGIAGLRAGTTEPGSSEAPTESLTQAGAVIGTVGYMSPEQVRGEQADHRSDIFSLGCLLYEVLSGKRAFQGETSHDTAMAVLNRDPDPIANHRPDVSPGVESVVRRCLEKEPDERFESARDVAFALQAITESGRVSPIFDEDKRRKKRRRFLAGATAAIAVILVLVVAYQMWRAAPPVPEEKHLAILPFTAAGDDPRLQESAAGLTRALASGLALIQQRSQGGFWVVPLDEAEDRGGPTLEDAHRVFNVTVAITGELRRVGEGLRLDLEAIDATTARPVRVATIEDSLSNLASFQEVPVQRVCTMLEIPLTPETLDLLASTATTTPQGFESFIRGIGILGEKNEESLDEAIALLENATSLDPLFAAGRTALGRAYLAKFEVSKDQEWAERVEAEVARVINDGPRPEEGYTLLADLRQTEDRLPERIDALENAVRVAPENAEAHEALARAYQKGGREEESERHYQRAIFLRPGFWPTYDHLAGFYMDQGRYDAAATQYREVVSSAPRLTRGYNNLGAMLSWLGHLDEAREVFEQSLAIEPSRSALSNLGTLYFDDRRFADAARMFELAIEEDDSRYLAWGNLAYAYKFGPAPEKADGCFRSAIELAEEGLESTPDDVWIMTDLASYNAMVGEHERGLEMVERAVAAEPTEPQLIAQIAEAYEDLGDRERALEWVTRSFEADISPSRYEGRPTLRELVADERYQQLAKEKTKGS